MAALLDDRGVARRLGRLKQNCPDDLCHLSLVHAALASCLFFYFLLVFRISAGNTADIVVISALTNASKGSRGISLFAVEKGTPGFEVAKRFSKLGKHASDTCLLTLENVEVPAENLLGKEGEGFKYMMSNLSKERLSIAVGSAAAARRALAVTLNYVHGRQMFGGVLSQLQSVQQ